MIQRVASPGGRILGLLALSSFTAIALGAVAMAGHDIPSSRWILNLAGWVIGALMALGMARIDATPSRLRIITVAGAVIVIASLAGPDQSGVHRWLGLGPLTINAAAFALPATIAAIARLPKGDLLAYAAIWAISLVLVAQPDASQSLAFCAAILLTTCLPDAKRGAWAAALLVGLTIAAFLRPDPLQPVAEVEQIFTLGWQMSPALAIAMAAALAATAMSFLGCTARPAAARAVALYAALVMLAPLCGWFPVPLAGSGVSFVIGLWLGAGVLAMKG